MCGRFTSLFCVCMLVCHPHVPGVQARSKNYNHEHLHSEQQEKEDGSSEASDEAINHRFFLREIFKKYGQDGVMTFKQFENLLVNLGLNHLMNQNHHVLTDSYLREHSDHDHADKDNHSLNHRSGTLGPPEEQSQPETNNHGSNIKNSSFNQIHQHENKETSMESKKNHCFTTSEIIHSYNMSPEASTISPLEFLHLCPALIHQLDGPCSDLSHRALLASHSRNSASMSKHVWIYATIAVLLISLCGLLCVAIIPIMQRVCYHTLIQFLIGMAVGSLSGDALLHLLPHAMVAGDDHHGSETAPSHGEEAHVWRGLTALAGVYIFFIAERLLNLLTNYRRRRKSAMVQLQAAKMPKLVQALQAVDAEQSRVVGEKLSHHKHGSYGYNVDPSAMEALQRLNDMTGDEKESPTYCDKIKDDPASNHHTVIGETSPSGTNDWENLEPKRISRKKSPSPVKTIQVEVGYVAPDKQPDSDIPMDECHRETVVYDHTDNSYVVTVTEHHTHHHGHGHSHEVPNSVSAVAWMVVMGDGLHNFCDGLAIGAAFAAEASGGLSTTIAVFCHELPHELGDFAMLLKAGMTVKQALLYNGLSSILCFIGMLIGVALGNVSSATMWVFAGAAGMFLYIALVDMLPELGSSPTHPGSNSTYLLAVQLTGISLGIAIMLIIAIYEHDLRHIVN